MNDYEYSNYISREYSVLKKSFILQCKKSGLGFSEDIFHDTLMSCYGRPDVDISNIKNYLFCAFKQNLIRDKQYACNSMHVDTEDYIVPDDPHDCTESYVEYNDIMNLLEKKFGKDLINIYKEHLDGYSIRELEEAYNIKGLNYKLNQVKAYTKKVL